MADGRHKLIRVARIGARVLVEEIRYLGTERAITTGFPTVGEIRLDTPEVVHEITLVTPPFACASARLLLTGKILFVGCYQWSTAVQSYDVSLRGKPIYLGRADGLFTTQGLVDGFHGVKVSHEGAIWLIDYTEPLHPRRLGVDAEEAVRAVQSGDIQAMMRMGLHPSEALFDAADARSEAGHPPFPLYYAAIAVNDPETLRFLLDHANGYYGPWYQQPLLYAQERSADRVVEILRAHRHLPRRKVPM